MPRVASGQPRETFVSFGAFLRFLRRRARLTQRELAIAVNYSEGQICHLEHDRRTPELATLAALFVPALGLEQAPDDVAHLLTLAAAARSAPVALVGGAGAPAVPLVPPSPLIGRAAQRAELRRMLLSGGVRMLTLTGPPGVGKTHLALQLAQDLRGEFADGALFVDLSAVDEAELAAQAIALALDLAEEPGQTPAEALRAGLRGRRMLLVLDNCEQLLAAAPLLADLLAAAPGLVLLLTSRVALRLRAEQIFSLPPLEVPDLAALPPPEALAQIESVALLLARLRAADPGLALSAANALALAAICVRVDGLPLAIELVASRGRLLSPQELLSEVAQQFQHLRRRGRDLPERHRTLAAALAWSHDQLTPAAQALFARLSVFAGTWAIERVGPVCDLEGAGRAALLDLLEDLIEHSLIQRHEHAGETRLRMLALVRDYAQERLRARAEHDLLHARLLAASVAFAERAEEQLYFSEEQPLWMARVEAEHDSLRAALAWAARGDHAQGLRLAGALWRFWYMRGMLREGRRWLETFLTLPPAGGPAARAHALDGLGVLAWRQGDHGQAEVWLRAALDLYRSARHSRGEARVHSHIGLLMTERGMYDQALASFEDSLPLFQALDDRIGAVGVLHNLGNLHCQQNNGERAMELYRECLAIYEQFDSQADIALVSLGMGAVARDQGEGDAALAAFSRSLELARRLGDEWTAGTALLNLGDLACDRGESAEALRLLGEALAVYERLGDQKQAVIARTRLGIAALLGGDQPAALECFRQALMLASAIGFLPGVAEGLDGIAGCVARGAPLLAARLYAAAAALREQQGLEVALADQPRHDQAVRAARRGSEPAAWATAWAEGRALGAQQAVVLALTGQTAR